MKMGRVKNLSAGVEGLMGGLGGEGGSVILIHHAGLVTSPSKAQPKTTSLQSQAELAQRSGGGGRVENLIKCVLIRGKTSSFARVKQKHSKKTYARPNGERSCPD